jgi:hypothetical protein
MSEATSGTDQPKSTDVSAAGKTPHVAPLMRATHHSSRLLPSRRSRKSPKLTACLADRRALRLRSIARHQGENSMLNRNTTRIAISFAALALTVVAARAADAPKYPNWSGQWQRIAVQGLRGQPSYDPTKSWGTGQQAPLTPEYQAVLEANLKDQENGGHGGLVGWTCRPYGMPMMMYGFSPLELVVTPKTTYVLINLLDTMRRIYTDDRTMPDDTAPSFQGYSTGHWVDQDGDGVYDALEVETRNFKGPRFYDEAGVPLDTDNESVFKERIYLDKSDANVLHDEITTIDHALTRPWTVTRNYRRVASDKPAWLEFNCNENNPHVEIGGDNYFLSAGGLLMPARKDQAPPDLKYFKRGSKTP